jgi:plasmid stabilization system protein ParE
MELLRFEVIRMIVASLISVAILLLWLVAISRHWGTFAWVAGLPVRDNRDRRRGSMPRGDKSKYTDKQERKAQHIEDSYESRSVPEKEAERRAWATVNKDAAGGKRPGGSGRGKSTGHPAAHKGGRKGGAASAARSPASRSAAARKAAATRKRNRAHAAT